MKELLRKYKNLLITKISCLEPILDWAFDVLNLVIIECWENKYDENRFYLVRLLAPRPGGGPTVVVDVFVLLYMEFRSWELVLFWAAAAAASCPALVLGKRGEPPNAPPKATHTAYTRSRYPLAPLMVFRVTHSTKHNVSINEN